MRVTRWVGYTVLALIIISIPAYWWLAIESHAPSSAHYSIDMTAVRRLADAGVADLPVAMSTRIMSVDFSLSPTSRI